MFRKDLPRPMRTEPGIILGVIVRAWDEGVLFLMRKTPKAEYSNTLGMKSG